MKNLVSIFSILENSNILRLRTIQIRWLEKLDNLYKKTFPYKLYKDTLYILCSEKHLIKSIENSEKILLKDFKTFGVKKIIPKMIKYGKIEDLWKKLDLEKYIKQSPKHSEETKKNIPLNAYNQIKDKKIKEAFKKYEERALKLEDKEEVNK